VFKLEKEEALFIKNLLLFLKNFFISKKHLKYKKAYIYFINEAIKILEKAKL
jgi:hypothetical protein